MIEDRPRLIRPRAFQRIEETFVDRYNDKLTVQLSGTNGTGRFKPFPIGVTYLHGAFFGIAQNYAGNIGCALYLDSITPENYVGGNASQQGAGIFSVEDDWFALGGQTLIVDFSGPNNGVVGFSIYGILVERTAIAHQEGVGVGFPSVPDVEQGTPAYDTPSPEDLLDRDPTPLDAPGTHRDRPTGYGRGSLYPDRPADASAPAAFPWPDGPAIPGGDY